MRNDGSSSRVSRSNELAITDIEFDTRINLEIPIEDQLILRGLARGNKKYIVNGVCQFAPNKKVSEGESFGEIHRKASARVETAYTITETHLLSLKIEEYLNIFEEPVRERRERIALFKKLLGQDFQEHLILQFANKFQRCQFQAKEKVFQEGKGVDGIYLITEGELELLKTETKETEETSYRLAGKITKQLEVAKLSPHQFFGCEELLGLERREYTAEVSSLAMSALKLESVHIREPVYFMKPFLKFIAESAKAQREWEETRLRNLRESEKLKEEVKEKLRDPHHQKNWSSIKGYYDANTTFQIPLSSLVEPNQSPHKSSRNVLITQMSNELASPEKEDKANTEYLTPVPKNIIGKNESQEVPQIKPNSAGPKLLARPVSAAILRPEARSFLNQTQQNITPSVTKNSKMESVNRSLEQEPRKTERLDIDPMNKTSLWKISQMKNHPKMRNSLLRRRNEYTSKELINIYDSLDGIKHYQPEQHHVSDCQKKINSQSKKRLQESLEEKSRDAIERIVTEGQISSPILHETTLDVHSPVFESRIGLEEKSCGKSLPNSKGSQTRLTPHFFLKLAKKKLTPFLEGMANASECSSAIKKTDESILKYIARKMPTKRNQDLPSTNRDQSTGSQSQLAGLITDFKDIDKESLPSGVRQIDSQFLKRKLLTASSSRPQTSSRYLMTSRQNQSRLEPSTEHSQIQTRRPIISPARSSREINLHSNTNLAAVENFSSHKGIKDAFAPFSPIAQRSLVIKSRGNL